jgi:hypothetical protein
MQNYVSYIDFLIISNTIFTNNKQYRKRITKNKKPKLFSIYAIQFGFYP